MFSWICPQCGRDVPPSQNTCPTCEERAKEAALAGPPPQAESYPPPVPQHAWPQQPPPPQPQQAWQPPPPQQAWAPPPPPQQYAQQPPPYAPPPPLQYGQPAAWQVPAKRPAPPTWVMGVGFAVAFVLVFGGIVFAIQRYGGTAASRAGVENPANPSRQKVSNPLQKWVEVVGVRLVSENKKPTARFIVVNHGAAEIAGLSANVTLWASTSRSEEDAVGTFKFDLSSLGPNDSKELSAPLKTRLKAYELPDWQNETAEIQITSPAAP